MDKQTPVNRVMLRLQHKHVVWFVCLFTAASLVLCTCFLPRTQNSHWSSKELPLPKYKVDKEKFFAKLSEPTPQWMLDQIEEDLSPFKQELSKKFLDSKFEKDDRKNPQFLVRLRVQNGKITYQKSKSSKTHPTKDYTIADQILPHFFALNKLKPLPNLDLIFTTHDGIITPSSSPIPIFAITKFKSHKGIIVMPDWFSLNGLEPGKTLIQEGNRLYPWETKANTAFYRGSDNGIADLKEWIQERRVKLVALSSQFPDLIDAKFHKLYSTWHLPYATEKGYMSDFVSLMDHPRYKYLISVDAIVAATPRFPHILHSNSVAFKDSTDSILWFFKAVKPYEHFIPIKEDLSDLFSQLEWAKNHEEECVKISARARKLASEYLTHEAIYQYLYRLLEAYAAKQKLYY